LYVYPPHMCTPVRGVKNIWRDSTTASNSMFKHTAFISHLSQWLCCFFSNMAERSENWKRMLNFNGPGQLNEEH